MSQYYVLYYDNGFSIFQKNVVDTSLVLVVF